MDGTRWLDRQHPQEYRPHGNIWSSLILKNNKKKTIQHTLKKEEKEKNKNRNNCKFLYSPFLWCVPHQSACWMAAAVGGWLYAAQFAVSSADQYVNSPFVGSHVKVTLSSTQIEYCQNSRHHDFPPHFCCRCRWQGRQGLLGEVVDGRGAFDPTEEPFYFHCCMSMTDSFVYLFSSSCSAACVSVVWPIPHPSLFPFDEPPAWLLQLWSEF